MDIRLTPPQTNIFEDPTRFRVVVAGRRFGKSYLSGADLINAAIGVDKVTGKRLRKQTVAYIAPTFAMCKQIMWTWLLENAPKAAIKKMNSSELIIDFKNGSRIYLKSAENYNSLRGLSLSFVVIDEVADIHPEAWSLVLRPALSDQKGGALFIGTPKGKNHFYDWYMVGKNPNRATWASYSYTTIEGLQVDEDEIEEARADLNPRDFRQEYEASFESLSNKVVDSFEYDVHVKPCEDTGGELLVGMDFNVDPMTAVVGVRVGDQLHIFKEYRQGNSNTRYMMEALIGDFEDREITVYPDPSGRARKTSAIGGQTDFTIIREFGATIIAPKKAPHNADSINCMNTAFMNGNGISKVYIDPSCEQLIKSLDGLTYIKNDNTGESKIDKKSGLDHLVDALKYLIWSEIPLIPTFKFMTGRTGLRT